MVIMLLATNKCNVCENITEIILERTKSNAMKVYSNTVNMEMKFHRF